jgi:hypothetical protein
VRLCGQDQRTDDDLPPGFFGQGHSGGSEEAFDKPLDEKNTCSKQVNEKRSK